MVNSEAFAARMERIMEYHGLTASAFADKIGVQRSGISHLLSGRNKPSLEFVMKVIQSFPDVNLYWLLNGKGSFPSAGAKHRTTIEPDDMARRIPVARAKSEIEKIIIFYSDGSFEAFDRTGI